MSRAWLFVPGHRPDRFDKAVASGADCVILDLEDAVAPADKPAARASVSSWLATASGPVAIRLNAADTEWFEDDLAVLEHASVGFALLPKAEDPRAVERIARLRPGLKVVPIIESALGMANVRILAAARGVARLAFGHLDFQVDMGMRGALEEDLVGFRGDLVLASRLANLAPPIDGVTTDFTVAETLATDVARARRLGFGGKLCIHPSQVAPVREGFAPGGAEVAWARRVLAAAEASGGAAVAVDGKMVDKPVILRAEAILRDLAS